MIVYPELLVTDIGQRLLSQDFSLAAGVTASMTLVAAGA
jgi:hypothetical protein